MSWQYFPWQQVHLFPLPLQTAPKLHRNYIHVHNCKHTQNSYVANTWPKATSQLLLRFFLTKDLKFLQKLNHVFTFKSISTLCVALLSEVE